LRDARCSYLSEQQAPGLVKAGRDVRPVQVKLCRDEAIHGHSTDTDVVDARVPCIVLLLLLHSAKELHLHQKIYQHCALAAIFKNCSLSPPTPGRRDTCLRKLAQVHMSERSELEFFRVTLKGSEFALQTLLEAKAL